jgi:hypothetical protein
MTIRIIFNGQEYASTEAMPEAVRTAYQDALSKLKDSDRSSLPEALERGETPNVITIGSSSITVNGREFKNLDAGRLARLLLPRAHSENFLRAHYQARHSAARVLPILLAVVLGVMIPAGVWMIWQLDTRLRSQEGGFHIGSGLLVTVALTTMAGVAIAVWLMLKKQGTEETGAAGGSTTEDPTTQARGQGNEGLLRTLDTTEHALARLLQILLGVAAGGVVAGGVWMLSHMDESSRSQAGDIFLVIGLVVALAWIARMYISIERRLKK